MHYKCVLKWQEITVIEPAEVSIMIRQILMPTTVMNMEAGVILRDLEAAMEEVMVEEDIMTWEAMVLAMMVVLVLEEEHLEVVLVEEEVEVALQVDLEETMEAMVEVLGEGLPVEVDLVVDGAGLEENHLVALETEEIASERMKGVHLVVLVVLMVPADLVVLDQEVEDSLEALAGEHLEEKNWTQKRRLHK